jgi:5-methylcytosine-specific restriction endonuclease McrA
MEKVLKVQEIKKCLDVYLMVVTCPRCNERLLLGEEKKCDCGFDLSEWIPDIGNASLKSITCLEDYVRRRKSSISVKKIKKLYRDQDEKCAYCFKPLNYQYHIEHVIPIAAGGSCKESNIVISCAKCNLVAGSKVFTDFWEKQRYILQRKNK